MKNKTFDLFEKTESVLNYLPEIKIINSGNWELKNYNNLKIGEFIVSFKTSEKKCPQGYLFENPNGGLNILGVNNLIDLRSKLGLKYEKFDHGAISKDIVVYDKTNNGLIIINSGFPLLLENNEAENLPSYNNLCSIINSTNNSSNRNRFTHLKNYLDPSKIN